MHLISSSQTGADLCATDFVLCAGISPMSNSLGMLVPILSKSSGDEAYITKTASIYFESDRCAMAEEAAPSSSNSEASVLESDSKLYEA